MRDFALIDYSITATTTGIFLPGGDHCEVSALSGTVLMEFRNGDRVIGRATVASAREFNFENLRDNAGRACTSIRVYTASGTQTCTVSVGEGARTSGKSFSGSVTNVPATSLAGVAADSMADTDTVTIAANSARKHLIIKNKAGSAGTLWVTDTAANNDGFPVSAGESLVLNDYTGAAQVYSDLANVLCVLEIS